MQHVNVQVRKCETGVTSFSLVSILQNNLFLYEIFKSLQNFMGKKGDLRFFAIFATGFRKIANLAIFSQKKKEKLQILKLRANLDISDIRKFMLDVYGRTANVRFKLRNFQNEKKSS